MVLHYYVGESELAFVRNKQTARMWCYLLLGQQTTLTTSLCAKFVVSLELWGDGTTSLFPTTTTISLLFKGKKTLQRLQFNFQVPSIWLSEYQHTISEQLLLCRCWLLEIRNSCLKTKYTADYTSKMGAVDWTVMLLVYVQCIYRSMKSYKNWDFTFLR